MIDIFDDLYNEIKLEFDKTSYKINFTGTHPKTSSKLPCVTMSLMRSTTDLQTLDNSLVEHRANMTFEFNVYTKSRKDNFIIAGIVSDTMISKGFLRTDFKPVDNYMDNTINRQLLRFTGVVDKNKTIFRR